LEASEATQTLLDAIKKYDKIGVDDYQRTYSWEQQQVEEFFADLCETADTREDHFFGTLIVQADPNNANRVTVVDGQQRLTTSFILAATLRDEVDELGNHMIPNADKNVRSTNVNDLIDAFLNPDKRLDNFRFESSRYMRKILDESVFARRDKQKPLTGRDRLNPGLTIELRAAIRVIRELVQVELKRFGSVEERLVRINDLISGLCNHFQVLKLATKDTNQSLEIFLTLNNRGQALGPSDIVRGQVMSNLGYGKNDVDQKKIQRTVFDEWKLIHENVGEPEVFLRHYLVATSDVKIQKKKIVKFVEGRMNNIDPEIRRAKTDELWDDLIESSRIYGQIINPQMEGDCQYHLQLLDGYVKSYRIVLLEVFRRQFDEKIRNEIVRLVFVLAYKWNLMQINRQKLEDTFQSLCVELRKGVSSDLVVKELKGLIDELDFDTVRHFSGDVDEKFVFKAILHYVNKLTANGATNIPLTGKNVHLEHIAPQTETREWLTDFFEGKEEDFVYYEASISSLGNLTLLDPSLNIGSSNDVFQEKRKNYDKSVIAITRDLAKEDSWNLAAVNSRTAWLADCFNTIWSSTPPQKSIPPYSEWKKQNS